MVKTMEEIKNEYPTMEKLNDYVIGQLVIKHGAQQRDVLKKIINYTYDYESLLEFTFLYLNKDSN